MKIRTFITALSGFCLAYSIPTSAAEKVFNYNDVLIESLRLNQVTNFDELAEDWLFYNDRETYRKFKNDEFEFQEKVDEAGKKLQNLVQKEEQSPVTFNIPIDTHFDEYNFEKKQFDYEPLTNGHMYVSSNTRLTDNFPSRINLYVSNPEIVNGIPMEKAEAKKFIQKRKNSFGQIDRSVILHVNIQFEKADELDHLTGKVLNYTIKDRQGKIIYQPKVEK